MSTLKLQPFSIVSALCVLLISANALGTDKIEIKRPRLQLEDILSSVTTKYPPYLAALIERDMAQGNLRSAMGAFDFQTFASVFRNPTGFYENTSIEAGFEQFTSLWGSTIFGGYRWTEGFLPDYYYKRRTDRGGTPYLGLKIPLLRDGSIDKRRAAIREADLNVALANPIIRRQHLDFTRASIASYLNWIQAGRRYEIANQMLQIANDRDEAIATRIEKGLSAKVLKTENRQIVLSRRIEAVKATRALEAASITLSLFLRDANDSPLRPEFDQTPEQWPGQGVLPEDALSLAWNHAMRNRPELKVYEIELQKLGIKDDFFRNQLLPEFDVSIAGGQSLGESLYKDTGEFELQLGIEFSVPLQRNEARGAIAANAAKIEQVGQKAAFAAEKIYAEIQDALSAVQAAKDNMELASENSELAVALREIESDRFRLGASDLLSLQIREQTALKAEQDWIKSQYDYYLSLVDVLIASAADFRQYKDSQRGVFEMVTQWDDQSM